MHIDMRRGKTGMEGTPEFLKIMIRLHLKKPFLGHRLIQIFLLSDRIYRVNSIGNVFYPVCPMKK